MFLRPLKYDQKKLFLGLAIMAAKANDVVNDSEERIIEAYADEMGISSDEAIMLELDELCNELVGISTKKELNQMYFEIISLLLGDLSFDSKEKEFLNTLCITFGIADEKCEEMIECVNEYVEWMRKVNILLFE